MKSTLCVCLLAVLSTVNAVPRGVQDRKTRHNYGIVGGKTADIKDFPYTVSIYLDVLDLLVGSGAILNKYWIVSSAYQFGDLKRSLFSARIGSSNAASGGQKFNFTKVVIHPQYDMDYPYDLLLLKTATPMDLGQTAKAVKLATTTPAPGQIAQLTGFGKTGDEATPALDLKVAKVKVLTQDDCKKAHPTLDDSSFCAHSDGVGPCESDIGSPLVSTINNQLIGFYIGGDTCNYYGEPEIYTNVGFLSKWIKDTIKKNSNTEEMEGFADDDSA